MHRPSPRCQFRARFFLTWGALLGVIDWSLDPPYRADEETQAIDAQAFVIGRTMVATMRRVVLTA